MNIINYFSYDNFNYKLYISLYSDLSHFVDKIDAWNHWINHGINESRQLCFFNNNNNNNANDISISFENFDHHTYLHLYKDLQYTSKEEAWHHWINHGIHEDRAISLINNSKTHNGRFGNLFLVNMAVHFICLKFDLFFDYKYYDYFKQLGIKLHSGKNVYDNNIILSDKTFMCIIECEVNKSNIIINNNIWCQTSNFVLLLKKYFSKEKVRDRVIKNNIYKNKYNNNNDLFVHVRLGDIQNTINSSFDYYNNVISKISFNNGYISSDSIENDICKKLISKYNLSVINKNEVETIMFASTCNNIILSGGTFSWLIGFFAFYSNAIYFPLKKNVWYGDIFIFKEWIPIPEI